MKIEKLTENKIRVLLKNEDIKEKNIDLHTIMTKAIESQGLFLEMLNQAEKQVGFNTDGYKLLIEAYSSPDNDFVFTITKYLESDEKDSLVKKKAVPKMVKPKFEIGIPSFCFSNFEDFCGLCAYINSSKFSTRGLARSISLHEYENAYYLVIKNLNFSKSDYKSLFSIFSEFGKFISISSAFESKLLEYGKVIIKHNALNTGIRYFAK